MEELQEADVLWPETPPPTPTSYQPELDEAAAYAGFSFEPFGSELAASSSSSTSSTSSAPPFDRGSSDGFLSAPSTFAGGHGCDDASFQEADVLWPDDGYATRLEHGVDGGELWRLYCGFGADAAGGRPAEPAAAGGKRGAWRAPLVSSPIDIPTRVATAARRRW
jgi:hypothetical protein